jgi:serine/threonine-protein kinase
MAPEMVLDPGSCDARTDVYLLGATLHQILTGTLRHRGSTLAMILYAATLSKPFAYGDDVAEDLAALANAATSRDRHERPASAAEFRRALLQHERHKEALGLLRAAREALAPLRDGTMRLAEPGAAALLFEARSLIAAASRAHPESARVVAARSECLALHIERDLAIESPSSARALLAELPAPRPDFEAAIAALEERIARAKASEESLRRERAEADTSTALRARSLLLLAAVLPMLLVAIALPLGLGGGWAEMSVETIAWTNLVGLATFALGVLLGRRRLFATRGNRILTWYGLGGLAQVVGVGLGALALDAPPHAALAAMHAVVAAYTTAGALVIVRELASVACCSTIFGALLVTMPDAAGVLSPLGLLGVVATSVASVAAHAARGRAETRSHGDAGEPPKDRPAP